MFNFEKWHFIVYLFSPIIILIFGKLRGIQGLLGGSSMLYWFIGLVLCAELSIAIDKKEEYQNSSNKYFRYCNQLEKENDELKKKIKEMENNYPM